MPKILIRAGGAINVLFFALHAFMGWQLHRLPDIGPPIRALLETFNLVVAVTVGFFAFVSLVGPDELLGTRGGRSVVALVALFYAARAAAEFLFAPSASWLIAGFCLLTAALYAAAPALGRRAPRAASGAMPAV